MKTARRSARELALNVLYQADATAIPFDEALATAIEFTDLSSLESRGAGKVEEAREYARQLASGTREHVDELDKFIAELSEGWTLDRQPAVDRNILRLAIYEIRYVDSVPPIVAVDEAIEMAKKYSTEESGKFVNGVLAGYLKKYGDQATLRHAELDSASTGILNQVQDDESDSEGKSGSKDS